MLRYVLRRLLIAVPTLLLISLVIFGLSRLTPDDPVEKIFRESGSPSGDATRQSDTYRSYAVQLGLDKAPFYFTVSTLAYSDTLYRVFPLSKREHMQALAGQAGNWELADRYEKALTAAYARIARLPDSLPQKPTLNVTISAAFQTANITDSDTLCLRSLRLAETTGDTALQAALRAWRFELQALEGARAAYKYPTLPIVRWHGLDNQYHRWLKGFLSGDMGYTWYSPKPVWAYLRPLLYATLFINGIALFLALAAAMPLGVWMTRLNERAFDRWMRRFLLVLYALPVFWLASLLRMGFATPGMGLSLIPGIDIAPWLSTGLPFFEWIGRNAAKLILPVLTLSLHTMALLALQLRGGMAAAMREDYIRTARAKGLDESQVHWRHGFRTALFPVFTILAGILPAILGGSIVVESIFRFPGMGEALQEAFLNKDFPVLFTVLMLTAVISILANLMVDLTYAWADPRVRYAKK